MHWETSDVKAFGNPGTEECYRKLTATQQNSTCIQSTYLTGPHFCCCIEIRHSGGKQALLQQAADLHGTT
ncbi:Hypothetical predicted protein [Podarcis lilfordi]|uniref:Uncharacterized protein n=1 Tax=Podarcis lilfordi TaxID=74358 RepID=A0AA35P6M3_9SAUR|nr:Hypothetical predicted protein [Podarcis lilfordi]